jgi:hypothetical protein
MPAMHNPDGQEDPTLARAAAIVADSRTIGAARRAIAMCESAAINSRTWSFVRRTLHPAASDMSRGRAIGIAAGAAVLHAAAASALPATALPAIPITAATLVAAIVALSGR